MRHYSPHQLRLISRLFAKLQEEIGELEAEVEKSDTEQARHVEEELGDLLFTAVNLARHLKVDPESALRLANAKFRRRFGAVERSAGGYDALRSLSSEELDALWNRAKELNSEVPMDLSNE